VAGPIERHSVSASGRLSRNGLQEQAARRNCANSYTTARSARHRRRDPRFAQNTALSPFQPAPPCRVGGIGLDRSLDIRDACLRGSMARCALQQGSPSVQQDWVSASRRPQSVDSTNLRSLPDVGARRRWQDNVGIEFRRVRALVCPRNESLRQFGRDGRQELDLDALANDGFTDGGLLSYDPIGHVLYVARGMNGFWRVTVK
jgi:hypothetical protein